MIKAGHESTQGLSSPRRELRYITNQSPSPGAGGYADAWLIFKLDRLLNRVDRDQDVAQPTYDTECRSFHGCNLEGGCSFFVILSRGRPGRPIWGRLSAHIKVKTKQ